MKNYEQERGSHTYVNAEMSLSKWSSNIQRFIILMLFLFCSSLSSFGQFTQTICQTETDALIGPDRNRWAHDNQTPVNESYLHNFVPGALPCGAASLDVTSLVVTIDLLTINTSAACNNVPIFGNTSVDCALSSTSVCPLVADILTNGCGYGGGAISPGTNSLDITNCGPTPSSASSIGVDIVPSTHTVGATCPVDGMAITNGEIAITYQICVQWTYDNACDDNDACTENDVLDAGCNCAGTLRDSDNDGVCDDDDICQGGDDNVDTDSDGIPDFCDPCNTGASCDDNDPCTDFDVYDANCNCAGTFQDTDGDGVCDRDDVCPNGDDNIDTDSDGIPDFCDPCNTGGSCNDFDRCTENDVYDANCNCAGTFADADGDGVCDADDICPNGDDNLDSDNDGTPDACDNCNTGATCDDNNPCTTNDVFDAACNCAGTYQDADGDGVCDADDVCPGGDDNIDTDNDGTPDACDNCNTGDACDDNDPCTTNDVFDANCDCAGTFADADNDGVCDADDICPGGDDNIDTDNDGTPDFCETCTTGDSCNDNDPCTINDVFDANCNCVGTFTDADNDGVCDADDICPGGDDTVDTDSDGTPDACDNCNTGDSCDDNDPCTTNDVFDANCNCAGTFADADNDGVCDADDICPNGDDNVDTDNDGTPDACDNCNTGDACDDNDPCTTNDVFDANCDCAGTFADDDGDGVCDTDDICPGGDDNADNDNDGIPDFCDSCSTGATCDDNDPCTTNDVFDINCNCVGTFVDADNDGVCDTDDICPGGDDNLDTDNDGTPDACDNCNTGDACDDNDPCTTNDVFDANCGCAGTFADADNDGVCDTDDICPGGDDNVDVDNDGIPDACDNCITGDACDDNDPCTTNDVFDANCDCAGTFADADNDGVCDADDICPGGDDNVDTDNDGIPDACDNCITGDACDDNDPCTINDVFDVNCNCAGTFADADNDGVCDTDDICSGGDDNVDIDNDGTPDFCDNCITGDACDDNDPCTMNDVFDANCNCAGTSIGCDTDGATSIVACNDGNPNTVNDTQIILDCDGSICVPCAGQVCNVQSIIADPVEPLSCDAFDFGVILTVDPTAQRFENSYIWRINDTIIGNQTSIEVFKEGTYKLEVIDSSTGCRDSSTFDVVLPEVEIITTFDIGDESCGNDGSITVMSITGGQEPYLFSLNGRDFTTSDQFSNLSPGDYTINVMDANGCPADFDLSIAPQGSITFDLGGDQTVILGDSIRLNLQTNLLLDSIIWESANSLSCLDCADPYARPAQTSTYRVRGVDEDGCIYEDDITITVTRKRDVVFVPNVFSPNQDGKNDLFEVFPTASVQRILQLKIFDRWGTKVFEQNEIPTSNANTNWDGTYQGKNLNSGVYPYFLEVQLVDGTIELIRGSISIMR